MLALPQRPTADARVVQLADNAFEHAAVIRIFLNLITCQTDRLPFTSPYPEWRADLESLLYFLDKYDSQPALKQLRMYGAELALHSVFDFDSAFIFAATTNDLALCIEIIQREPHWDSNDYKEYPAELRGIADKSIVIMSAAPLAFAAAIPFPYSWALSRTSRNVHPSKHSRSFSRTFHDNVVAAFKGIEKCESRIFTR